ncbi:MAG: rhomboid family intramembrane serine protease [Acidimicrobiia bacterium]
MVLPLRDDNPTQRIPIVTLLLIALNIGIYAFWQPHGALDATVFGYEHAAVPCEVSTGHPITEIEYNAQRCGVAQAERTGEGGTTQEFFPHKNVHLAVLTSMFLHGSWAHVLGNMLFLWIFGNNVEDRFGRIVFVLFFLACGLLSFASYYAFTRDSVVPLLGASGAIAGVMGAYVVLWPRARVLSLVFFVVVPLPAYVVLGIWFGLQFLTDPHSHVAWIAHVGGFAVGAALAFLLARVIAPPGPPPGEPPDGWLLHP